MQVTFSIGFTPPDRRIVERSFHRDPNARLVSVSIEVSYTDKNHRDEENVHVASSARVQRLKQDGTDSAHPVSGESSGEDFLTDEEYETLAASLVREAHDYLRDPRIVNLIEHGLAKRGASRRNKIVEVVA